MKKHVDARPKSRHLSGAYVLRLFHLTQGCSSEATLPGAKLGAPSEGTLWVHCSGAEDLMKFDSLYNIPGLSLLQLALSSTNSHVTRTVAACEKKK